MTKATKEERHYLELKVSGVRVHGVGIEVTDTRWLKQQLRTHILNHKQKAESQLGNGT